MRITKLTMAANLFVDDFLNFKLNLQFISSSRHRHCARTSRVGNVGIFTIVPSTQAKYWNFCAFAFVDTFLFTLSIDGRPHGSSKSTVSARVCKRVYWLSKMLQSKWKTFHSSRLALLLSRIFPLTRFSTASHKNIPILFSFGSPERSCEREWMEKKYSQVTQGQEEAQRRENVKCELF